MSYTSYIVSKSVLHAPYSVKKYLLDSLSVLSEVAAKLCAAKEAAEYAPKFRGTRTEDEVPRTGPYTPSRTC